MSINTMSTQLLVASGADAMELGADELESAADGKSSTSANPLPLYFDLSTIGKIPDGYRVMKSTGKIIPQSMHSSSQSAHRDFVVDWKEIDHGFPHKASSQSTVVSHEVPNTEVGDSDDEEPFPAFPDWRKVARRERRMARVRASCAGCCHDPPFGHPSQRYHMDIGGCMDPNRKEEDSSVSSDDTSDDDGDDKDTFPNPKARAGDVAEALGDEHPAKRAKVSIEETPPSTPLKHNKADIVVPETPEIVAQPQMSALRIKLECERDHNAVLLHHSSKLARAIDNLIGHAVDKLGGDRGEIEKIVDDAIAELDNEGADWWE